MFLPRRFVLDIALTHNHLELSVGYILRFQPPVLQLMAVSALALDLGLTQNSDVRRACFCGSQQTDETVFEQSLSKVGPDRAGIFCYFGVTTAGSALATRWTFDARKFAMNLEKSRYA